MRLLKPSWVSHEGQPIFSIDIHPDGSRFVTGGQGNNAGKVVIWNMQPVLSEKDEKDEKIPKIICQMDNHLACVNCVRWSYNGKFLASGGDDKLIMIWQTSKYGGMSTVFGSGGKVVNLEQWRVVSTLRGHTGDVLDLAWSPHDAWLATCSIDNTIVIWNALKFPEQVTVLRGHSGLVKGVTWDPVCKYVASQSDDKTLRVWRTLDWQQEACVTEPFLECGGTTHVLRLNWSPDGHYIVSAHAMNNSGPTAQIIEREGWKTSMDFVGHRKAITVVRFNPNIFKKRIKKGSFEKEHQYSCCAIGSRDRSLSIWLTVLKRPLVVTHDLFSNSILDLSWSKNGLQLLCCSWDGTVAYLDFGPEEIGNPLSQNEKVRLQEKIYGKSILTKQNLGNQIIETPAMLNLQQKKQQKDLQKAQQQFAAAASVVNGNASASVFKPSNKQIETRTKDGKRRITPILLAPQLEPGGEAPLPFSTQPPTFSTSTEQSHIIVEKKAADAAAAALATPPPPPPPPPQQQQQQEPVNVLIPKRVPLKTLETAAPRTESPSVPTTPTVTASESPVQSSPGGDLKKTDKEQPFVAPPPERLLEKDKMKMGPKRKIEIVAGVEVPRKKDGRGRPRKDRSLEAAKAAAAAAAAAAAVPAVHTSQPAAAKEAPRIVYTNTGLNLPTLRIEKSLTLQVSGAVGSGTAVIIEVENDVVVAGVRIHKVRCIKSGSQAWESVLTSKVAACAGNSQMCCIACDDQSLCVYSTSSGRTVHPSIVLDSKIACLKCSGQYAMAITLKGNLSVWNFMASVSVIRNESLVSIIPNNEVTLESSLLTEQGLPVLTLSNGKCVTYKTELACWVVLTSRDDTLQLASDHQSCLSARNLNVQGPLATLQAARQKAGQQATRLFRSVPTLQQSVTVGHLERQVANCLSLKSSQEYRFWLMTYVRYLVQEDLELKLQELCDELLGPTYKRRSAPKWDASTLGFRKRDLLQEILPILGSNLRLQRLYTEYQEQLEAVK